MLEQPIASDPARKDDGDQVYTILATDRLPERHASIFVIDYAGQPTKNPEKYVEFGSADEARAWLAEWTGRLNHGRWTFSIFRMT